MIGSFGSFDMMRRPRAPSGAPQMPGMPSAPSTPPAPGVFPGSGGMFPGQANGGVFPGRGRMPWQNERRELVHGFRDQMQDLRGQYDMPQQLDQFRAAMEAARNQFRTDMGALRDARRPSMPSQLAPAPVSGQMAPMPAGVPDFISQIVGRYGQRWR
jgi:hypothetical protein